jgi:glycogen phosphorylase
VHTGTWLARRMRLLFDDYLGQDWRTNVDDPDIWESAGRPNIPDESCGRCAAT